MSTPTEDPQCLLVRGPSQSCKQPTHYDDSLELLTHSVCITLLAGPVKLSSSALQEPTTWCCAPAAWQPRHVRLSAAPPRSFRAAAGAAAPACLRAVASGRADIRANGLCASGAGAGALPAAVSQCGRRVVGAGDRLVLQPRRCHHERRCAAGACRTWCSSAQRAPRGACTEVLQPPQPAEAGGAGTTLQLLSPPSNQCSAW